MRALLCRSLGSIDNLEVGELPSPDLSAGHVRIAVKASGINFPDILMAEGKYQVKPDLPFVPGLELAGEVLEAAPDVDRFGPGDRVMGFARFGGAHAEEAVLPVTPNVGSMRTSALRRPWRLRLAGFRSRLISRFTVS